MSVFDSWPLQAGTQVVVRENVRSFLGVPAGTRGLILDTVEEKGKRRVRTRGGEEERETRHWVHRVKFFKPIVTGFGRTLEEARLASWEVELPGVVDLLSELAE